MVRWQDRYSRQFRVSQGVCQGALLSPLFYATFVNDLLTILESHKLGISIGSVYFVGYWLMQTILHSSQMTTMSYRPCWIYVIHIHKTGTIHSMRASLKC